MRRHIEAQSISGLTVTEYCAQNGIVKSNYYYWHRKLSERKVAGFTPIHVTGKFIHWGNLPQWRTASFVGEINTVSSKHWYAAFGTSCRYFYYTGPTDMVHKGLQPQRFWCVMK